MCIHLHIRIHVYMWPVQTDRGQSGPVMDVGLHMGWGRETGDRRARRGWLGYIRARGGMQGYWWPVNLYAIFLQHQRLYTQPPLLYIFILTPGHLIYIYLYFHITHTIIFILYPGHPYTNYITLYFHPVTPTIYIYTFTQ